MAFKKIYKRVKKIVKNRYGSLKSPKLDNIVSDVAMLKRLINVEKKYLDIAIQNNVGAKNGLIDGYVNRGALMQVAEGTDYKTRNGNSTKCTSMVIKGNITSQTNGTNENYVDLIVYQYNRFVAGVGPVINNFFEPDQKYGFVNGNSLRDMEHMPDFRVLRKLRVHIPAQQITGAPISKPFTLSLNFGKKGIHQRYEGPLSSDLTEGAIFLLMMTTEGDLNTTSGVTVSAVCRSFFVDN